MTRVPSHILATLSLLAVAGCGPKPGTGADNVSGTSPAGVSETAAVGTTTTAPPSAGTGAAKPDAIAVRTGELVNPSNVQMVFLYHSLAGVAPPIDKWTEDDARVKYAQQQDRAPQRALVKSELAATEASVANIGRIRLDTTVDSLPYDPTYGEFRVGVFAPSSSFPFETLGETVSIHFGNGQSAQIWRVPKDQSQAVLDRIGADSNFDVQALLRITGVQPEGSGGGTIVVDVVEYELTSRRDGHLVGKIKVDGE